MIPDDARTISGKAKRVHCWLTVLMLLVGLSLVLRGPIPNLSPLWPVGMFLGLIVLIILNKWTDDLDRIAIGDSDNSEEHF